jgi:predicted Zn-dependent protease
VRIADGGIKDALLRDTIVYLTCLHESGHALGLPHTAAFADIMYSFQYGGDIPEYFGRYRRKLTNREDIRKFSGISDADRTRLTEVLKER